MHLYSPFYSGTYYQKHNIHKTAREKRKKKTTTENLYTFLNFKIRSKYYSWSWHKERQSPVTPQFIAISDVPAGTPVHTGDLPAQPGIASSRGCQIVKDILHKIIITWTTLTT